jgi:hypothetical protein
MGTKTTEKTIKLSALKPNERNPRKISDAAFDRLLQSVKRDPRFMELRPLVVDEKNVIIGGNQRYRALLKLRRKEVPASWVKVARGLTAEQRKRFVVIDNSPEGMAGYWDFDVLNVDFKMPELEELGFIFPEQPDMKEIWKGMPEFDQEDRKYYKQITVRFMKKKDYDKFASLIGQNLTENTKAIWYPKLRTQINMAIREEEYVES